MEIEGTLLGDWLGVRKIMVTCYDKIESSHWNKNEALSWTNVKQRTLRPENSYPWPW